MDTFLETSNCHFVRYYNILSVAYSGNYIPETRSYLTTIFEFV